jgi:hypothetical protein
MTAAIFLVMAIAMIVAVRGYRGVAIGFFGIGMVAAVLWFHHHATDSLKLAF